MKKRSNALILACLPVIGVLILLGMGIPQRVLPAVHVGNHSYTIAEYNFYHYEAYSAFVTAHREELDELGLDINSRLKGQQYDADTTWAEYFRAQALDDMQEYEILCAAANADGFDASAAVAANAALQERLLREYCVMNNVTQVSSYLTGVYDAGMTEETFYAQQARRTKALAYRDEALMPALIPDEAAVAAYAAGLSGEDYPTANLVVCYFATATDRQTGEREARQWENAQYKAEQALLRATEQGGGLDAFCAVAGAYSDLDDEAAPDGRYTGLTHGDLVDTALLDWVFDDARKSGDSAVLRGSTGCYLLYFDGWGESSLTVQARQELTQRNYADWLDAHKGDYAVRTNAVSMQIAR